MTYAGFMDDVHRVLGPGAERKYGRSNLQRVYGQDVEQLHTDQLEMQAATDNMKALEVGRLGLPGAPPMPQGGVGSILPPGFSDPVTGGFKLPEGMAAQIRRMGLDPETVSQTVNRNLLERTGADYQTRLLYGQSAGTSPDQVQAAKEQLFSKTARALEGADEPTKQRIMAATFTGPNANQLLAEFNAQMAKEVNKPGPWDDILRAGKKYTEIPRTAIGQIMSATGGLGDVVRAGIGVATGASHGGKPVTARDVGREAAEVPKDLLNLLTLGGSGLTNRNLRSTSQAPGIGEIASTMRTRGVGDDIAQLMVPFLGPTRFLQTHDVPGAWAGQRITAMLGDIATDPTSYVTLGSGGLGKAGTRAVGEIAERASLAKGLGLADDLIPRYAAADQHTWEAVLTELRNDVGDRAFRVATDDAKAFRVQAETAHGTGGWGAFSDLLGTQGVNADDIVPRGFLKLGRQGKLSTQLGQARGGVSLRGGIGVGPFQVRGFANLRAGTGQRGIKPVGSWFTQEGNRFHQAPSRTLDAVAEWFNFGSGSDREFLHNNKGLFNATMEATTFGRAVRHAGDDLKRGARRAGDRLKSYQRREPEANRRIIDIIEKGEGSDYWTLVPADVRRFAAELADQIDAARELGNAHDVPIATLREIADSEHAMLRYFPHKVKQAIGQDAGFQITPSQVGASRARKVRSGSTILGQGGEAEVVREGTFAEIQDITQRVLGAEQLEDDPLKIAVAYIGSVANAAALNKTYRTLSESGLLVPNVADVAMGGIRGGGDPVRGIWAQPMDNAVRAHEEAQAAVGRVSEDVRQVMRDRALGASREAEIQAQLSMYAARHADADSKIHALKLSKAEREEHLAIAARDFKASTAQAKQGYAVNRRALAAELKATKVERKRAAQMLKDLDDQHATTLRTLEEGYTAQQEVLGANPMALKQALHGEINRLGREAVGGHRPFNQVRQELVATRHRLAQVEGGELAAGKRGELYERALRGVKAKRQPAIARSRAAQAAAEDLNEQIAELSRHVDGLEKGGASEAVTRNAREALTRKMTERAVKLREVEDANKEAAGLWDIVDMGEASMRVAELRQAEVLAHEAGATIDAQAGRLSERIQKPLARLLQMHAADLVAEASEILAMAPRLKFLDRAAREFSRIDTSVAAIPPTAGGRALQDFAGQYLRSVEGRADEILKSWEAAVGDQTKAYTAARQEYTRQMSALLAREDDLATQAAQLKAGDPQLAALASHQREGDDLNFFRAELDKDTQQLEWWQDYRDEVRKTQTLQAVALGEAVKGNEELSRALGAAQRLQETDHAAAAEAFDKLFGEPRIFELMGPQVEHLAAVVGKLPFMEGGAAMPMEVARVVDRVMHQGPEAHSQFMQVVGAINTKWKRSALFSTGSVFRRIIGNVYNAVVLAGVSPSSFDKSFRAINAAKTGKSLDAIGDPALRRYMELAMEQNIFEGQFASLATDTAEFQRGPRHLVQGAQEILQLAALRGEDVARLAQFIDGLDAGMGPSASRLWTGKYHFFNNELTQTERGALRPLYPFYAYLRNNFALQFYTLFHQPGKIAAYGYLMRDMGAEPTTQTTPGWVEQEGGFPITGNKWLQNTMLDTSPLGALQTIAGVGQRGEGSGWSPTDLASGDLIGSMGPLPKVALTALTGIDPQTGEKLYPQDIGEGVGPMLPMLRALGAVNDAGKWNPRALAMIRALFPTATRAGGIMGGLTPSQGEQGGLNNLGLLLGPNIRAQGPRQERGGFLDRGRVLDDIIAGTKAQGGTVPSTQDLTDQERTRRAIQQLLGGG